MILTMMNDDDDDDDDDDDHNTKHDNNNINSNTYNNAVHFALHAHRRGVHEQHLLPRHLLRAHLLQEAFYMDLTRISPTIIQKQPWSFKQNLEFHSSGKVFL